MFVVAIYCLFKTFHVALLKGLLPFLIFLCLLIYHLLIRSTILINAVDNL